MKVGDRVLRGKDWDHRRGDLDGNGPGTVVRKGTVVGMWKVKWDNTPEENYHCMGHRGKYQLAIINFLKPMPTSVKPVLTLAKPFQWKKKISDFKIICDGKTINCHKIVLGAQSDVFETMFLNMDLNEAKSGEVEIEDFDFDTVETLIYFPYNEDI